VTAQLQHGASPRSLADSELAGAIKSLLAQGKHQCAGKRFEELVVRHQHRATRIAFYYLREAAEVDEVVQDAFLKAFTHLSSFREELLFGLWFTKILVNACLDRIKSRNRRARWLLPSPSDEFDLIERCPSSAPSPETSLLAAERRTRLRAAIDTLPDRQRTVVVLSQFEGHSARDIGSLLGLNETTVRVHLFRAIRSLRKKLSDAPWLLPHESAAPRPQEAS